MKNILVITVNWLGDVIFSSPIFKALKKRYPDVKISCMAPTRVRDILESIDYIDDIIIYDDDAEHRSFFAKLKLINEIRKYKFDVVFILHRSFTKALLSFLAGIPIRVGYDTKGRGKLLTHIVKPYREGSHRSDNYINIVESFGVNVEDRNPSLSVSIESNNKIDYILNTLGFKDGEQFIVINPGGNWALKRWPYENYSLLINYISEHIGLKIIISGAKKDEILARKIKNNAKGEIFILAGKTSIKDMLALMNKATLVISADSGPLHLADSIGTKTIGIFGPTSPKITGPIGCGDSVVLKQDVGCNRSPCYFLDCRDNICMKAVSVYNVFREVKRIIDSYSKLQQ